MEDTLKIDGVDEKVSLKSKHSYSCNHHPNMHVYTIAIYHGVSGMIYKRVNNYCMPCNQDKINLRRSCSSLDFRKLVLSIRKKAREKKYLNHNHTHELT